MSTVLDVLVYAFRCDVIVLYMNTNTPKKKMCVYIYIYIKQYMCGCARVCPCLGVGVGVGVDVGVDVWLCDISLTYITYLSRYNQSSGSYPAIRYQFWENYGKLSKLIWSVCSQLVLPYCRSITAGALRPSRPWVVPGS